MVSVAIGSCDGDSCRWCCTHNVEPRQLVARGRLRRILDVFPGGLGAEIASSVGTVMFKLEQDSLCYLDQQ